MFHQRTLFGSSAIAGQHWLPATGGSGDYTTGLIHWYPLTDAQVSGLIATDNVVTGNINGDISATGISSITGPNATYPQGRGFSGGADVHINFASALNNWGSGSCSVAFWGRINNNANLGGASYQQTFVYFDNSGDGTNFVYITNRNAIPGGILFNICKGGAYDGAGGINRYASNTWFHFVGTKVGAGAGTTAMYINKVSLSSGLTALSNDASPAISGSRFLGDALGTDGLLTGGLASLRLYNRALSPVDVGALFDAGG